MIYGLVGRSLAGPRTVLKFENNVLHTENGKRLQLNGSEALIQIDNVPLLNISDEVSDKAQVLVLLAGSHREPVTFGLRGEALATRRMFLEQVLERVRHPAAPTSQGLLPVQRRRKKNPWVLKPSLGNVAGAYRDSGRGIDVLEKFFIERDLGTAALFGLWFGVVPVSVMVAVRAVIDVTLPIAFLGMSLLIAVVAILRKKVHILLDRIELPSNRVTVAIHRKFNISSMNDGHYEVRSVLADGTEVPLRDKLTFEEAEQIVTAAQTSEESK